MNGDTAVYERGWPDADSAVIAVTPKADASVFASGLDNTTDEYRMIFTAPRSGGGARIEFSLPTVANVESTTAVQMPPAIAEAREAARSYGIRALWGIELAGNDSVLLTSRWAAGNGAGMHLATYLPADADPAFIDLPMTTQAALTANVLARGGITSIAHPFGTTVQDPTQTFEANLPLVDSLGAFLVSHHAWNANLIEVGYVVRGGVGLREHLYLLDYLLSSGVNICGVGVTDSHGQRLLANPAETDELSDFVTWIGGVNRASSAVDLLQGMRDCQLSFGNPFYVNGGMWIQVVTEPTGQEQIVMDVGGVSPSAAYYLFELVVDPSFSGHEPIYRQYGQRVLPGTAPEVGGCQPSYARLEAWASGRPLAFSNVVAVAPASSRCLAPSPPVSARPHAVP
jgi:hypothetical protein